MKDIVPFVITAGIPLLGLAVSWGITQAKITYHAKQIDLLEDKKAEKDVVVEQFKSVHGKLDMLIDLTRNGIRPKKR